MSLCVIVFYYYAHVHLKVSMQHMTKTLLKWSLKQVSGTIVDSPSTVRNSGNFRCIRKFRGCLVAAGLRMRERIITGTTPEADISSKRS